jgi:Tfp pilus assembly protein PilF
VLLNHLALAVLDQQRDEEAAAILNRSVSLDPEGGQTHFYLASVYLGLDRLDDARDAYERAVALIPNDPDLVRLGHHLDDRLRQAQKDA